MFTPSCMQHVKGKAMTGTSEQAAAGQVSDAAARIYEAFYVPALFTEWASPICEAAAIGPGDRVLDIACGTGIAAREAARRAGQQGKVIGVDRNPGMLAVAREQASHVEWREGRAEALPFGDGCFDAVLCQFGLMFFEDQIAALREMHRVLRAGGRAAVAVWDGEEHSPGYAAMISLLDRMCGTVAADALRAPFVLGNPNALRSLLADAGWQDALITTRMGTARFNSVDEWVKTDVRGWTLSDMVDDQQFAALLDAARVEMARFTVADGSVRFAAPGHIVSLTKR